jgi:hypothetical protein
VRRSQIQEVGIMRIGMKGQFPKELSLTIKTATTNTDLSPHGGTRSRWS